MWRTLNVRYSGPEQLDGLIAAPELVHCDGQQEIALTEQRAGDSLAALEPASQEGFGSFQLPSVQGEQTAQLAIGRAEFPQEPAHRATIPLVATPLSMFTSDPLWAFGVYSLAATRRYAMANERYDGKLRSVSSRL